MVDYDDELSIERVKPDWFQRANIDSRTFNQAEPYDHFVYLKNVVTEMTRPVGSVNGATSTLITIRENPFKIDDYLDWGTFAGTTRAADKPDLASYIPAADYHRLVVIFWDEWLEVPLITASTSQLLTSALDSTDYDECFAQLLHNEYKPLLSLKLADAQTSIDINDVVEDLRQFVNTPKIYGVPNPIPSDKAIVLRSTHQLTAFDLTIEGELTIEGDLLIL